MIEVQIFSQQPMRKGAEGEAAALRAQVERLEAVRRPQALIPISSLFLTCPWVQELNRQRPMFEWLQRNAIRRLPSPLLLSLER